MKTGTVRETTATEDPRKYGRFYCSLEIPKDMICGIGESANSTRIELNLPIGDELDLSQLQKQLDESELSKAESEGLIEEIHTMIEQTMVGSFLRRYLVFDK